LIAKAPADLIVAAGEGARGQFASHAQPVELGLPSSLWQKSKYRENRPAGAKAQLILRHLRHD
jgi:hypothetical protein